VFHRFNYDELTGFSRDWAQVMDRLAGTGTFKTSKPGDVLKIDLRTKAIETLSTEAGNLEGITKAGDVYYITDWVAGKLPKIHAQTGDVAELITGLRNPTDPGYAEELGLIAFPQHTGDQLLFVRQDVASTQ